VKTSDLSRSLKFGERTNGRKNISEMATHSSKLSFLTIQRDHLDWNTIYLYGPWSVDK
jgi:hypothetical protein